MEHNHPQSKDRNESQHLGDNTHGSNFRFDFARSTLEMTVIIVLFLLLMISLTINALDYSRNGRNDMMLKQAIDGKADAERAAATELALRRYNLDWFRSHEFAELEVKVGVLEKMTANCRR
jgi:hypothetical protein